MINKQELRIGNKILYGKSVVTVVSIESKNLSEFYKNKSSITVQIANGAYISVEDDGYSAIELTEEWLLKFGFNKKSNNEYSLLDSEFAIYFNEDNNKSIGIMAGSYVQDSSILSHIKYVHQLQNLYFALSGFDLVIKEDK